MSSAVNFTAGEVAWKCFTGSIAPVVSGGSVVAAGVVIRVTGAVAVVVVAAGVVITGGVVAAGVVTDVSLEAHPVIKSEAKSNIVISKVAVGRMDRSPWFSRYATILYQISVYLTIRGNYTYHLKIEIRLDS
jgi:hypothetical protein